MHELIVVIVTAVLAFATTNIDDIFLLMLFFSQVNVTFRPQHIVLGQYLGFAVLVGVSMLGYFGTLAIPRTWIGLLGLVPIALGIRKLLKPETESPETAPLVAASRQASPQPALSNLVHPQTISVASITVANGGDNIGIYVPLFARGSLWHLGITIIVFFLLVGLWCFLGASLGRHPTIAQVLGRYGHVLVPFVLIGLGIFILAESGIFPWF